MKYYFLLVALFVVLAGCSRQLPSSEHNNFHRYGIERGEFHYEFLGNTRGTEDIYFDHYGEREANVTHSELIAEKGFRPTLTDMVRTLGKVTIVDSVQQVEVHTEDPMFDSLFRLPLGDVPSAEEQFQRSFSTIGYVPSGDTVILGLRAHIMMQRGTGNVLYEWNGISLGSRESALGTTTALRLTSFDTTKVDTMQFYPAHVFAVHEMPPKPQ